MKLVVELPMTVDLSLFVAPMTDTDWLFPFLTVTTMATQHWRKQKNAWWIHFVRGAAGKEANNIQDRSRRSTSKCSYPKYPWSGRIEESSRNANWRSLQTYNDRQSGYNTAARFTNTGVGGKNELCAWFWRISWCRISLGWKFTTRSQSTGIPSPCVHVHQSIHHRHLREEWFTLGIWMLQMGTRHDPVQGDTGCKGSSGK